MNPQSQESTTEQSLPAPHFEHTVGIQQTGYDGISDIEKQSAATVEQNVSNQSVTQTVNNQQAIQSADPTSASAATNIQQSSAIQSVDDTSGMPAIADDTDLIEKAWVVKAKDIVAKTAKDPHQQNKEITKIKADYLKKRFNKSLKMTQE